MLNLTSTWVCNTNFETWMRGWVAVWWGIVFKDGAVVLLWWSDDRRKNTRTRTPWCIADRPAAGIEALPHYYQLLVMRSASKASLFSLGFPRKNSLFITGRTSIRCQKKETQHYSVPGMFVWLCVWFNIVIGHLGRPYSTHTASMPVLTGSVHAVNERTANAVA